MTHPSEILKRGEIIEVQVTKVNNGHISIGMKQLRDDSWETDQVADMYPLGSTHPDVFTKIWDNCYFAELEPDAHGLVPVSETSKTENNGRCSARVSIRQKVDVTVGNNDAAKRELTLKLNPYEFVGETLPDGATGFGCK